MDPRLLRVYNEELAYLREAAREFGEEHEVVAGRLGLKTPTDPDPYVERLLEGVAFLNARVQLKLRDQFPEFTQHLLQAVQPHYLAPMPSICVAGFEPREGEVLAKGYTIPRLTDITAIARDQRDASVIFRTGHEVTLWPIAIAEAEYLGSRAAIAPYAAAADVRAEAGVRIRIVAKGGASLAKLPLTELPLYLAGSEAIPGELYRQLIGETCAVLAGNPASGTGAAAWTHLTKPVQMGFEASEALLPHEGRSFRGYRLLSEYFACPERFLFVKLTGLDRAFASCTDSCDIVLLFTRGSPVLVGAIDAANFKLFAAPAINLFEKQLGRVQVSRFQHEYHVVPDRTRPLDFEVYRLLEVTAFAKDNQDPRPVAPLYAFGALLYDWREALFYATRMTMRRLSTREQRLKRRGDYVGTETWLSLTSPGDPERLDQITELGVRALVTNRELPELLTFRGTDHFSVAGAPVRTVTVLRAPTRPRPPLGFADSAWRVIGHLTPNYAALAPEEGDDGSVLRDHLALYGQQDDPAMRRQIDGIQSVSSQLITRRVPDQGRTAFARGHQIRIGLDDGAFESGRLFLFTAVLERFLAEFASINSFTESIFTSPLEGVLRQWPPRIGRQPSI